MVEDPFESEIESSVFLGKVNTDYNIPTVIFNSLCHFVIRITVFSIYTLSDLCVSSSW